MPSSLVDAALGVADRDDLQAEDILAQLVRELAGVAVALDRCRRALQVHAQALRGFARHVDAAAGGCIAAAQRAEERHGLAGDDAGQVAALDGLVLIHHPGHDLRRGVHVGRRHVLVFADEVRDAAHVAPAQPLEFRHRQALGVADDAALAAAQRDVDDGGLPGHPGRQRPDGVDGLIGMEADAALGRAAGVVVLHAEALEGLVGAVVHLDGDAEMHLTHGHAQECVHGRREAQQFGRFVKLVLSDLKGIECGHLESLLRVESRQGDEPRPCKSGTEQPEGATSGQIR